jgi:hypothetical protein
VGGNGEGKDVHGAEKQTADSRQQTAESRDALFYRPHAFQFFMRYPLMEQSRPMNRWMRGM